MGPSSRAVLITGASRNIGALLAKRLASEGDTVVIVARNEELLREVENEIRDEGGSVVAIIADISRPDEIERIVQTAQESVGSIDVLVNNAVSRLHKPFLESTDKDIAEAFDVSTWSAIRLSRALLPAMMDKGWGRIVSMVGSAAQAGASGRAGFVAAKAGVVGLTKALALEFAEYGITVNAVSPGTVDTNRGTWTLTGKTDEEIRAWYHNRAQGIPVKRLSEMVEICYAIEFLISDKAAYITGHVLNVNGGKYT